MFVGNLFLVARIWDAFNDPMMGFVVDNTKTKWGKFRPWILIGAVVNSIILIFLFHKPAGMTGTADVCLFFSDIYPLGMSYTIIDIPIGLCFLLFQGQKKREIPCP